MLKECRQRLPLEGVYLNQVTESKISNHPLRVISIDVGAGKVDAFNINNSQ